MTAMTARAFVTDLGDGLFALHVVEVGEPFLDGLAVHLDLRLPSPYGGECDVFF
jgi:hypothetical protein